MARFFAPDLTQLPRPTLIEEISAEVILADQKAWVLARWDEVRAKRPDLPPLDTLGLETEPMTIVLEQYAYRETLVRANQNDKARAVLLAYAQGAALDHLGVRFGCVRMTGEADERYRRRIQLAPEAFSTCGPRGAYIYFALTYSLEIADAWAWRPGDGRVNIVLAGPNGADVSDDILNGLYTFYQREDAVPLTDDITVYRAIRTPYDATVVGVLPRGPDPATIEAAMAAAISAYCASRCKIKTTAYQQAIGSAAKVGGIENVAITLPVADVVCDDNHIPVVGVITATTLIVDD